MFSVAPSTTAQDMLRVAVAIDADRRHHQDMVADMQTVDLDALARSSSVEIRGSPARPSSCFA